MRLKSFVIRLNQRREVALFTVAFALLLIVALPSCKNQSKHSNDSSDELTRGEVRDLTKKLELVEKEWADVENQYQRRFDLYKILTKTVEAAASHENETQLGVTQARAQQMMQAVEATADSLSAVGGKINPTDEKALNDYVKAQQKLSEQMQIAINVVHEAYPDLNANENYLNLLIQLEGAENRIAVACKDYNFVVKDYNKAIKKLGKERVEDSDFKEVPLIKQEECAEKAPDVSGMLE